MIYITGQHALNLECDLLTTGDWHTSALAWENITFADSDTMFFKDYGIEYPKKIPNDDTDYYVANHIRAILDCLEIGNFAIIQGMRDELICNDNYTLEIFKKVYQMICLENWAQIDAFMGSEYYMEWVNYKRKVRALTMDHSWRNKHKRMMVKLLKYINSHSQNYILKDSTALMICYNLDRFSEYIDLDSVDASDIKTIIADFVKQNNYEYYIAKDTDAVKIFMIDYGDIKALKLKVSYRKSNINNLRFDKINNIIVYNFDELALMKVVVYSACNRLRDLSDLTFICNNYWNELSSDVKNTITNHISNKGLEKFEYLINTQTDELIDKDKLTFEFLEMYDKLNLVYDSKGEILLDKFANG